MAPLFFSLISLCWTHSFMWLLLLMPTFPPKTLVLWSLYTFVACLAHWICLRCTDAGNVTSNVLANGAQGTLEKIQLLKDKISSNASAMPVVVKRMQECLLKIDKLDSQNLAIHPAFKRKRTSWPTLSPLIGVALAVNWTRNDTCYLLEWLMNSGSYNESHASAFGKENTNWSCHLIFDFQSSHYIGIKGK